jgi:hypothetical protein
VSKNNLKGKKVGKGQDRQHSKKNRERQQVKRRRKTIVLREMEGSKVIKEQPSV